MAQKNNSALPLGHQVEGYTIKAQLSMGGFSIVYLAEDENEKDFAIKEYLPSSLALRQKGEIQPEVKAEHQNVFRYGMKCFFEEGRALAAMRHPNVVRVVNFFRANNTVYMVMEYVDGHTLHEVVFGQQKPVSERYIRGVFTRVLNGLREVHASKLLHLDLKPSNIYMSQNKIPVLIDFGAARQTLAQTDKILKPMYTPGFASPEHYGDMKQLGPWSDIYSVGASMYALLGRKTPQAANERKEKDEVIPARKRWRGRYSDHLLEVVDWCMDMQYMARPQSVYSLQKILISEAPIERQPNDSGGRSGSTAKSATQPNVKESSERELTWIERLFSRYGENGGNSKT